MLKISNQGSNPRRFIMFPKDGGDLCAHRAGGASTYRFVCARHNPYFLSYHDHYRSHRGLELLQNTERKRLVSPQERRNERQGIT